MRGVHILYRFFAADNTLLYVGITNDPLSRFGGHCRDKSWFRQIAHSTMEHFESRQELEAAEIHAIKTEKPKYNIAHSVAPLPKRIGVKGGRAYAARGDASNFPRPDAIACDEPTPEERESRLDALEEQIRRAHGYLIPGRPCPSCNSLLLTREYDGLIKCVYCLDMFTDDDLGPSDLEVLKSRLEDAS